VTHVSEEPSKLRRLLDVGRTLVAELDYETVLERILEEAREITGARYAALGVLSEDRSELERFLTKGIDDETHRAIGDLPRGRGVLGVLIEDPRPLCLTEVGEHPQSYGFPPGHPPMSSFLGVPVVIRGQAWGNLYLTEKHGGKAFTEDDQEATFLLAQLAATAIENARLHERSEHRRIELERAVRSLEAARDVTLAVGSVAELDQILELIVKRGRALVNARSLLIMLREGTDLVVAAAAGQAGSAKGHRLPLADSLSGEVLRRGRPQRITDAEAQLLVKPKDLGIPDVHTALLVPMLQRGEGIGVLAAYDRREPDRTFSSVDEELLRTFAQSAANAVAISRSVETDRLRSAVAAADRERGWWARELHDQTLQALGGLRVLLASALRRGDPKSAESAMRQAIADIEEEIANLRALITDLRPSLLDDLGLLPALEALAERRRGDGLQVDMQLELPPSGQPSGLDPELETTVYRLVQEALTNVIKHAHATTAWVTVKLADAGCEVRISDDGVGFDASSETKGFGITGMRERAYLAGSRLELESTDGGTSLLALLPASRAATTLVQDSRGNA
jgi:signal transduction histidine kinase